MPEPATTDVPLSQTPSSARQSEPDLGLIVGTVDAKLGQFLALLGQLAGQIMSGQSALQAELKNMQAAGPQRMMFGMYRKLFVELLQHMNQLDSLVDLSRECERTPAELAWIEPLEAARDRLESTLSAWGVVPMTIRVREDEFDPDRHEGVASEASPQGDNLVVRVHRRGWLLNDVIIQYPQVAVS